MKEAVHSIVGKWLSLSNIKCHEDRTVCNLLITDDPGKRIFMKCYVAAFSCQLTCWKG